MARSKGRSAVRRGRSEVKPVSASDEAIKLGSAEVEELTGLDGRLRALRLELADVAVRQQHLLSEIPILSKKLQERALEVANSHGVSIGDSGEQWRLNLQEAVLVKIRNG